MLIEKADMLDALLGNFAGMDLLTDATEGNCVVLGYVTGWLAAVVDEKCLMCDKTDWYNCNLRRIITDLPVDVTNVPNGCWRDAE